MQGSPESIFGVDVGVQQSKSTFDLDAVVHNCDLACRRVGTKRAKCMTRTTKKYYKRLQATRQKSIHDIADGILSIHILCCFDVFDVHEWFECMDDTNCIVDEDVQGRLSECKGNSMEVGVFTESEYIVVSEEK